jgi:hypothetical protein
MDEDEEMYRLMNKEDNLYMGDTDDGYDDDKKESHAGGCSKAGCVPLIVILGILLGMFF